MFHRKSVHGFWSHGGRKLAFSITVASGFYNSLDYQGYNKISRGEVVAGERGHTVQLRKKWDRQTDRQTEDGQIAAPLYVPPPAEA